MLLSDGTGNSAGKLFRTNVWRFYQALDLSTVAQIARYDDGVGSSSIRPIAMLGGAIGFGLKRNLIDLYMFLCRNYQSGDEIYGVGFSRGAFTIRLLVQFVLDQGLVTDFNSDSDLRRKARKLYRRFRSSRENVPPLAWVARGVGKVLFDWPWQAMNAYTKYFRKRQIARIQRKLEKDPDNRELRYSIEVLQMDSNKIESRIIEKIRFVGLWDTVDAYGIPIVELKRGVDTFIWPLSLQDRDFDPRIIKACHALSIDDKRSTFHPLLWDETAEAKFPLQSHTDLEALTQVWFAGVHSNLGGGYPDDGMSYVPLRWMVNEAHKQGLEFKLSAVAEINSMAAPYGRMYDSRSGLGFYYRYNPRRLAAPTDEQKAVIRHPKIHETVIWRMAAGTDGYAPLSLPNELRIVADVPEQHADHDPAVAAAAPRPRAANIFTFASYQEAVQADGHLFGAPAGPQAQNERRLRAASDVASLRQAEGWVLDLIWDTVWWRRVAYFVTLIISAVIVTLPILPLPWNFLEQLKSVRAGEFIETATPGASFISNIATPIIPAMFRPWISSFALDPIGFVILATTLMLSLIWGTSLDRAIQDRALAAWNAKWRARRFEWLRARVVIRAGWCMMPIIFLPGIIVMAYSARDEMVGAGAVAECAEYGRALNDYAFAETCRALAKRNALLYDTFIGAMVIVTCAAIAYVVGLVRIEKRGRLVRTEVRGLSLGIAYRLRTMPVLVPIFQFLTQQVIPASFAVALMVLAVAGISRFVFAGMSTMGFVCVSNKSVGHPPIAGQSLAVDIANGCENTGVVLEAGTKYLIRIERAAKWSKSFGAYRGHIDAVDAGGVVTLESRAPLSFLFVPFRRHISENWLVPVLRVGDEGADETVMRSGTVTIEPRRTGELFFYVNDVVLGLPGNWQMFYGGNHGTAILKVQVSGPKE